MKENVLLIVFLILLISGCSKRAYFQTEVESAVYKPNTVFRSSENLSSPKFAQLVEKYQLDTIFHGETDELKRILLLRHWIKAIIKIDDFGDPYPGGDSVEGILDEALKGAGFHCAHYMKVQNAIMNAYGYVTRTLGAGPGVKEGPNGHHGINEIWLNSYQKWFLSDAKYDHHFEKDGVPLSALEVRDEYLKNRGSDIIKVKGPDRTPIDADPETGTKKERSAQTYTWIEFHGYNDMFTAEPHHRELLIVYEDEYFRNNTWYWGKGKHWAYDKPEFMLRVPDRDAMEWTPNTIVSNVKVNGKKALIELISDTPNFMEYQVKESPSGEWKKTEPHLDLELKEKNYEVSFRAVNLANVAGPEHKIRISGR